MGLMLSVNLIKLFSYQQNLRYFAGKLATNLQKKIAGKPNEYS